MNLIKKFSLASLMLLTMAVPALAGTTVSSPASGSQVSSPFNLTMYADTCSSLPVIVVGYSLDDSTSTAVFTGQTMNGPVTAANGSHILHVKVWNSYGQVCVTDVAFAVGPTSSSSGGGGGNSSGLSVVPANAVSVGNIQTLTDWSAVHDGGTPGNASGWMGMTGSPSLSGNARVYSTYSTYYGGMRYAASFGDDPYAQNFLYDTWVYIGGSSAGISNLEFDLNQTLSNGETVIMGFQCDSWTGTWDYSVNTGSATSYNDTWGHSSAGCNVKSWGVNQWHHVQILYSHTDSGWVTYKSVWLDGNEQDLYTTVFSGYYLGWRQTLLTNFQVDGSSSGSSSSTVYMDKMTVYRW